MPPAWHHTETGAVASPWQSAPGRIWPLAVVVVLPQPHHAHPAPGQQTAASSTSRPREGVHGRDLSPMSARPVGARGHLGNPASAGRAPKTRLTGLSAFPAPGQARAGGTHSHRPAVPAGWGRAVALLSGAVRTPFPRNPHREWGCSPLSLAALWGEQLPPFWGYWPPPAPQSAGSGAHSYSSVSVGPVGVWVPQEHPP